MVDKEGDYYRTPFKGYCGATQGDTLYPKIFNMVVETIVCQWVTVVAVIEAGSEGLITLVQDLVAYFYAGDVIVTLTQTEILQRAFDVLTDLFDRVGLWTNMRKANRMACNPCHMNDIM